MFRFKQFTVDDAMCAMKVGTDGVLLGAWAPCSPFREVLDVGTGSGLIALMIAQRMATANVLGIDVDACAVRQAEANFAASPWADRLQVKSLSLQELAADKSRWGTFDLIVSNPPYFVDSLKNPDAGRRLARHTDTLSFEALTEGAARLLTRPAEAEETFIRLAKENGLSPYYTTRVHTREGKPAKRVLMALRACSKAHSECVTDTLVLQDNSGAPRSAAYQELCRDFYL